MKTIMQIKESQLYNSIDKIRNCNRYIKQSTDSVWGKNVIRHYTDKNGNICEARDELHNWYIELPCDEKTDIPTLIGCFKYLVERKENGILKYLEEKDKFTCHQLCDWHWLTDERGKIIRNGTATLVKYAIILEDFKEQDNGI